MATIPQAPKSPIQIFPAEESDCLELSAVQSAAFASNPLNEIMFGKAGESGLESHASSLKKKMTDDPPAQITKAVIDGEIVAFSLWYFYHSPKAIEEWRDHSWGPSSNDKACNEFFGGFQRKRNEYMSGRRYALLSVLVTRPDFQGRGIASMLLKQGLTQADQAGLPVWLEASESGYALYKKNGFEDVEKLVMDLTKYGGTGTDVHTCMLRPAKTALNVSSESPRKRSKEIVVDFFVCPKPAEEN